MVFISLWTLLNYINKTSLKKHNIKGCKLHIYILNMVDTVNVSKSRFELQTNKRRSGTIIVLVILFESWARNSGIYYDTEVN